MPSKPATVVSQSVPMESIYPTPLQQIDDIMRNSGKPFHEIKYDIIQVIHLSNTKQTEHYIHGTETVRKIRIKYYFTPLCYMQYKYFKLFQSHTPSRHAVIL
jgi:hypothetical protein